MTQHQWKWPNINENETINENVPNINENETINENVTNINENETINENVSNINENEQLKSVCRLRLWPVMFFLNMALQNRSFALLVIVLQFTNSKFLQDWGIRIIYIYIYISAKSQLVRLSRHAAKKEAERVFRGHPHQQPAMFFWQRWGVVVHVKLNIRQPPIVYRLIGRKGKS